MATGSEHGELILHRKPCQSCPAHGWYEQLPRYRTIDLNEGGLRRYIHVGRWLDFIPARRGILVS